MASLPTCVQCGGREFFIESGFYFCAECQIQSEDIREEVMSEFLLTSQVRSQPVRIISQNIPAEDTVIDEAKGNDLTSWEVLNYILKGWVDELIRLGVDPKLKMVAMQLWVTYLQKLEVAFTSTVFQKKPRLGFTYRTRDAELVYGAAESSCKLFKNPFSSKSSRSSASSRTSVSSIASKKLSRKRKLLAKAVYEEESIVLGDVSKANVSLENLSVSSTGSNKSRLRYTAHAKGKISALFGSMDSIPDEDDKAFSYKRAQISEKKSLRHLNIQTMFALVRLALLICKSPVQLSDMFRWSQEGYLSLRNVERLVPPSVVTKDVKALLSNPLNSWVIVTKKTYYLCGFLGVLNINVDIQPIIKKLAQQLHLPDDIEIVVNKLLSLSKPNMSLSATVNYEGRAVAFIIFILKLVLSLDGKTEFINSKTAKIINKGLDATGSEDKRLFVWTDWVESIEFRDAVISKFHIPTRELSYPGAAVYDSSLAFIGQWSMAPQQQMDTRLQKISDNVASTLDRIIGPLTCEGMEPPKPSMIPSVSLIRTIGPILPRDTETQLSAILEAPALTSIETYINTEMLILLAEDNGCRVKFGVPVRFRDVGRHSNKRLKPNSKHFQDLVTVSLTGDSTSSDVSDDSAGITDTASELKFFKRKLKREKSRRKLKKRKNVEDSDDQLSSSDESSLSDNLPFSNMTVNTSSSGNRAIRVDLNDCLTNYKTLENEKTGKSVLYIPDGSYWLLDGSFYNDAITIEEFEEFACTSFSPSFLWLLRRCSSLVGQSMRDVYQQLILIENVYLKYVTASRSLPLRLVKKW